MSSVFDILLPPPISCPSARIRSSRRCTPRGPPGSGRPSPRLGDTGRCPRRRSPGCRGPGSAAVKTGSGWARLGVPLLSAWVTVDEGKGVQLQVTPTRGANEPNSCTRCRNTMESIDTAQQQRWSQDTVPGVVEGGGPRGDVGEGGGGVALRRGPLACVVVDGAPARQQRRLVGCQNDVLEHDHVGAGVVRRPAYARAPS